VFSRAENPVVIRCRPSPHRLSLMQALSFNVVPHCTRGCRVTPDAAERCEQPNDNRVKTPSHQQEGRRLGVRWATPFLPFPTTDSSPPAEATTTSMPPCRRANGVSRDDASKAVMRFNVENSLTREGKTTSANQQALHYDQSPVTNANGGGLQEVK
jgi:hypothetical protein